MMLKAPFDLDTVKPEPRLLIWAYERRHADTGQPIPDEDRTLVTDLGYGPVQGSRKVRLWKAALGYPRMAVITVDTRDLWEATPEGTFIQPL